MTIGLWILLLIVLLWFCLQLGVDVTVTVANVAKGNDNTFRDVISGDTITAGQPVYLDASDSNKAKRCDSNVSQLVAAAIGVALHASLAGQPLRVITGGTWTPGFTTALGVIYCVSSTAGGIAPSADMTTGDYVTVLMIGSETTAKAKMLIGSANGVKA